MIVKIKESGIYREIKDFFALASEKRIDTYSAGASFYIFISFIPFSLILLSTIKYLPFSREDLLSFIGGLVPAETNWMIMYVIDELYERGIGVLSVSIIAALWASGKGVLGITKGLNDIFDVGNRKNFIYMRTRSAICTFFLMLGMLLMVIISVLGNTIMRIVMKYVSIPEKITSLLAARDIIMFFVLFLLYMFFFCVLPSKKMKIRSQVAGAAGAGLLWILFTKIFSFYLSTFNGYSTYGSLAAILVAGIWLYTGMYLMFMGALANRMLASRKGLDDEG